MRGELSYVLNPVKSRLKWLVFYVLLITVLFAAFYIFVGRIRTHSLPTGQIDLGVPYSKYLLGEEITFTVTNNFNSAIFAVNNCPDVPLGVYRFESGKWVRMHGQAGKDCTDEDRRVKIAANSIKTVSLAPWASIFSKPGKYRLIVFVEYYNALPYKDIEVVAAPITPATPDVSPAAGGNGSSGQNRESDYDEDEAFERRQSQSSSYAPITYTVQVTSSGNYNITSLSLNRGDYIKFVYTNPNDEIRTQFTSLVSGSMAISSLTLDRENSSGTRVFSSAGSWRFKADDVGGNTGTVTVK